MPVFTATQCSLHGLSSLSHLFTNDASCTHSLATPLISHSSSSGTFLKSKLQVFTARVSVSGESKTADSNEAPTHGVLEAFPDALQQERRSADWKAARAYNASGSIYHGRVAKFNSGGLLVRFYSLLGFLPYPQLSPSHCCKDPHKGIQEIAEGLVGSLVSVKIIQAEEENRRLIVSEKEAVWSKFSRRIKVGDFCTGRVGQVESYGAFVHLRFPDGLYHLTGMVHVSEVSWDLVRDVRDVLTEGDDVRVKIIDIDRQNARIKLSIKQLEEDPLLETLDKVIPQDDSAPQNKSSKIEPLPGLEAIFQQLTLEDGIEDVKIRRQGFEKRVVSQDLQLWLANAPPINRKFTLLARAGRQVQEIQLTTTLDQEGVKKALQRVMERVP